MRADHAFKVIDAHAGGAPSRLVFSGIPPLIGQTPMDKMRYFEAHHDWIRRSLVLEPRGGNLTSAIVVMPPSRPDAHVDAFFMEAHGYLPMCGSDTISTVTALIETGQVPSTGEQTVVRLNTPAGLIEATAHIDDGRVAEVTFVGAPAFCAWSEKSVDVPGFGSVTVDIAYGGNFYVIAEASQFDVTLEAHHTGPAVAVAHRLHAAVHAAFEVEHPVIPEIRGATHVQLFTRPEREFEPTRVMVVIPTGNVDRSPCGTGTTAKVATLFGRGELALGEPFVHQSVTGATFTGRAVEPTMAGTTPACRVAITGSAFITADATVYVDRADVLAEGFQLG
jgi:proline racemase